MIKITKTLKALRKLFMYSYVTTINKKKPDLKEVLEFKHLEKDVFRIKTISQQKTDFDDMFQFMEDKNLFAFWVSSQKGSKMKKNIFLDFSKKWIDVDGLKKYQNRNNCIYLLYHSNLKQIYVGKANVLGERVKKGHGRIGLDKNWDKFMYFEINPEYRLFLEQIEMFSIVLFASILKNELKIKELNESDVELVNRQLKTNKH